MNASPTATPLEPDASAITQTRRSSLRSPAPAVQPRPRNGMPAGRLAIAIEAIRGRCRSRLPDARPTFPNAGHDVLLTIRHASMTPLP